MSEWHILFYCFLCVNDKLAISFLWSWHPGAAQMKGLTVKETIALRCVPAFGRRRRSLWVMMDDLPIATLMHSHNPFRRSLHPPLPSFSSSQDRTRRQNQLQEGAQLLARDIRPAYTIASSPTIGAPSKGTKHSTPRGQ